MTSATRIGWGVPAQAGSQHENCPLQGSAAHGSPLWDHWFPPGSSPYMTIPDVAYPSHIGLLCTAIREEWYVGQSGMLNMSDIKAVVVVMLPSLVCWCASSCTHWYPGIVEVKLLHAACSLYIPVECRGLSDAHIYGYHTY